MGLSFFIALVKLLPGLSRCTVCRKGAAHIAPSAAALGHFMFIELENPSHCKLHLRYCKRTAFF